MRGVYISHLNKINWMGGLFGTKRIKVVTLWCSIKYSPFRSHCQAIFSQADRPIFFEFLLLLIHLMTVVHSQKCISFLTISWLSLLFLLQSICGVKDLLPSCGVKDLLTSCGVKDLLTRSYFIRSAIFLFMHFYCQI